MIFPVQFGENLSGESKVSLGAGGGAMRFSQKDKIDQSLYTFGGIAGHICCNHNNAYICSSS